jgi:Grx4 family monothiol glutaredoxin
MAIVSMERSKQLADEGGHVAQAGFVASMIEQAKAKSATVAKTADEEQEQLLQAFAASLVCRSPVILFMKGTITEPQCGFSKEAVETLVQAGVEFDSFDVMNDSKIAGALKRFSNWPTFPQLYAGGVLVGGSDILREYTVEDGAEVAAPSAATLLRMDMAIAYDWEPALLGALQKAVGWL